MTVKMFNLTYFIYIAFFVLFIIVNLLILKGKSEQFKKRYISGILFFALIVHFCKLLFPPYNTDEFAIRKITPENICAVSTLIFPFVFLSNNKTLKDYMFYMGVLSGCVAIFFPTEAFGKASFCFDTIRFFVCHTIIAVAPFLMVATGLHKLNYRRIYRVPVVFFFVMATIMINEIILQELGIVAMRNGDLLDRNAYRNFSMVFGLTENFDLLAPLFEAITPNMCLKIPYGPYAGSHKYWPLVWIIFPSYILFCPIWILFSLPWEKDHLKNDFVLFKDYLRRSFQPKKIEKGEEE